MPVARDLSNRSQANFHTSSTPPAIDIYMKRTTRSGYLHVAPAASVTKLIARSRGRLPPFTAVEWLTSRRSTSHHYTNMHDAYSNAP